MFETGRPLTAQEVTLMQPYFARIVLERARIVDGKVPFWLSQRMCAVVLHHRIYFRTGAYQPNTRQGAALLGHELTHVSQYLHGMTVLKYLWSCRYGYRNSRYEVDAYAMGDLVSRLYLEYALEKRNTHPH
jgi:Domain of unknown function (DUF4157)